MYKRILVPTDGSTYSVHAIRQGLELAKALGAEVTFLHVLENPIAAFGSISYSQEILADLRRVAQDILERTQQMAQETGVLSQTLLVEEQNPVKAIIKAGEEHDLIVMGTHGRRGLDLFLLGSVTDGVVHRTKKPILVVHGEQ